MMMRFFIAYPLAGGVTIRDVGSRRMGTLIRWR